MKTFELVIAGTDETHVAVDLRWVSDTLEESQAKVGDHVNIPVMPKLIHAMDAQGVVQASDVLASQIGNLCFRRTS